MLSISKFFDRFKLVGPPNFFIRKNTSLAIKKITGIDVPVEKIAFKNNVLYVNENPIVKNEIFLYKNDILFEIKKHTQKLFLSDLR